MQPESLLGNLPAKKKELIAEAGNYSFDFFEMEKEFVLKKALAGPYKIGVPVCGQNWSKKQTGVGKKKFLL